MKICIVGPGIMPIPPTGWGAVEILIWDYKETLEKLGHEVVIVNTPNPYQIIEECNRNNPDFVHIQYDEYWQVCDYIKCENVGITGHYAYKDQPDKHGHYYTGIINGFSSTRNANIFALSHTNAAQYKGIDPSRVFVVPNGVRTDLFSFNEECELTDRSIYLAKIDQRKRQYLFQNIEGIDFVGNLADQNFTRHDNYLGEWNKNKLYNELTKYSNLVLLSDGEAHPLVCLEAMSAGLGLVISEFATAHLDTDLPFIDVIPENMISDKDYVSRVIEKNRKISVTMRKSIREYVERNFSWEVIIQKHYIPAINTKK
jgi:glycosyltransferase involved in cell wall biosynthesis